MSGYTAFRVSDPAAITEDTLCEALTRGRIGKIDVDAGFESAYGFAEYADPLSTRLDACEVWLSNTLAVWSFRVDSIKVPASTLKLHIRKRVAENLTATRRTMMPKAERDELAEQVRLDLLKRTPATIKAVGVVYDAETGLIRLDATSEKMIDFFVARAQECLGVNLTTLDAVGVIDSAFGANEAAHNEIYHLLPTAFVGDGGMDDGED